MYGETKLKRKIHFQAMYIDSHHTSPLFALLLFLITAHMHSVYSNYM